MTLPKFTSDAFLAPMAGVTDVAFRLLCKKYGAGLTCTEMISANALARKNGATLKMIDLVEAEQPRMIQLFGQNVPYLIKAAKFCENKCEIIDLNFGCPASKILKQGAGSALLERPNHIYKIVKAVSTAVNLPVTVKIRLGICKSRINVLKIAQLCEQAGAAMITVHARTQNQGYTGQADWNWIKKVKETVTIPVCGNGDIRSVEDYIRMKQETGCDYVMIGRGALGRPYFFQQIKDYNQTGKYHQHTPKEQLNDFRWYLKEAQQRGINFNNLKIQAQYFTTGLENSTKLRLRLSTCQTVKEIEEIMFK